MSATTKKHRAFISEPMGEKPVTELAGIGAVLGKRLTEAGYSKAYSLLGQFLILKKDERSFKDWLKGICGANVFQQAECFQCLKGYCEHFV